MEGVYSLNKNSVLQFIFEIQCALAHSRSTLNNTKYVSRDTVQLSIIWRSEGCRDEIRQTGSFRRIKRLTKEAQMVNGGGNLTAAKIIICGERYTALSVHSEPWN